MAKKTVAPESTPDDEYAAFLKEQDKKLGLVDTRAPHAWLPSGCSLVDWVMGQGYPMGRMVVVDGQESAGKSFLAYLALRSIQRIGGKAYLYDTEPAYDEPWVRKVGVATDQLTLFQPDYIEEVMDSIEDVIEWHAKKNVPAAIVWDSLAASSAKAEEERSMRDTTTLAEEPRALSRWLKRPNTLIRMKDKDIVLIVLNQIRDKIGVSYGKKTGSPGGRAVKHYASIILSLRRESEIVARQGGPAIGQWTEVDCEKNKCAPPARKCRFPIFFDYGIDNALALIDYAKDAKAIPEGSKGWLKWPPSADGQNIRRADLRNLMLDTRDREGDDNVYTRVEGLAKQAWDAGLK